jgi:hypothetical protein
MFILSSSSFFLFLLYSPPSPLATLFFLGSNSPFQPSTHRPLLLKDVHGSPNTRLHDIPTRALELADILLQAYDTPSGIPTRFLNPKNPKMPKFPQQTYLAGVTSCDAGGIFRW